MNETESKFDVSTADLLDGFAQRISRRGIIARLGKLALTITGISLIPNLPLDRSFVVEAQGGCTDWSLCGICGRLCTSCCGGGGLYNCPTCTTKGSFWAKCCQKTTECSYTVSYYDCCGGSDAEAASCSGTLCERDCLQPQWCGGVNPYRCTIIKVNGTC